MAILVDCISHRLETMFKLHQLLAADTIEIGDLPLCKVLLMNNAHLPWVVLVPRRADIRELYELSTADQIQAHRESILISKLLMNLFEGDKLNTGVIGNIVPQLHLHHVVRYESDPCWPKPVWGNLPLQPYSDEERRLVCSNLKDALQHRIGGFRPH